MAGSFDGSIGAAPTDQENKSDKLTHRKVLVTGAAGNIGSYFAQATARKYDLRLLVRSLSDLEDKSLLDHGEVIEGNLGDLDSLRRACAGVDTVLHLAAVPNAGALWKDLLETNIVGTYNMLSLIHI